MEENFNNQENLNAVDNSNSQENKSSNTEKTKDVHKFINNLREKINSFFKKLIKIIIKIVIGAAIVAMVALAVYFGYTYIKSKNKKSEIKTQDLKTIVEKVIKVSNLSTNRYVYNGIFQIRYADLAEEEIIDINDKQEVYDKFMSSSLVSDSIKKKVKKDDVINNNIICHVSYEGTVDSGIDFSKIGIVKDEDLKLIKMILPEIKITDRHIDTGKLDYIFFDNKFDDSIFLSIANKLAYEDLDDKKKKKKDFYNVARENAIRTIEGLTSFIKDTEYDIDVSFADESIDDVPEIVIDIVEDEVESSQETVIEEVPVETETSETESVVVEEE